MSVEQAKVILNAKDISTPAKKNLYMKALAVVSGSAFKVS